MDDLRYLVKTERIRNEDGHWFIPHGALDICLTPEAIANCLGSCSLDAWDLQELTNTVTQGSRKVFAILLLIHRVNDFVRFVEDDGFQDSSLDAKIPFSLPDLKRILGNAAGDFFEEQWQFSAPKFTRHLTHRYFQFDVVLPFTSPRLLGRGGFGQISDVTIIAGQHDYGINPTTTPSEIRVARKELDLDESDPSQDPKATWQNGGANEHRVLSALHHMRNPYILELLASYTYRKRHYLLFPIAQEGDLKAFLSAEDRLPKFSEDANIWTALAGLASAIQTTHNYNSTTLQLKMIGYHHDINPKNILVSGDRFILSDFGLSKLQTRDDSRTVFKVGRGFYLAPECENLQLDFAKGTITRASDIWSFGCVLLEVMVFMHYGKEGVQIFSDDRKTQTAGYTTRTFFAGDRLHPAVDEWMCKISCLAYITSQKAIRLIRKMLCMSPDDRPKADQVKRCLRLLSIESHLTLAEAALQTFQKRKTFDVFLEEERLKSWASVFGLGSYMDGDLDLDLQTAESLDNDLVFPYILESLRDIRDAVSRPPLSCDLSSAALFRLRELNDRLFNQLSSVQRKRASSYMETILISNSDKIDDVMAGEWPPEIEIGYREATRQLRALYQESSIDSNSSLQVRHDAIRDWMPYQACVKAKLFRGEGQALVPILIEWIIYDKHWIDETGENLFRRIGTVVEVLRNLYDTRLFPILNCGGYFHAPERRAFGLIYELPAPSESKLLEAPNFLSLYELIVSAKDVRQRPMLDDLFILAQDLARALLKFHKVGWLHKALNSYNVIFIYDQTQPPMFTLLKTLQIIGFNHSRPDHPNEYTEGVWAQSQRIQLYQDSEYLRKGFRYSPEQDYFSFGLVLLEIGMWKCLDTMLPQAKPGIDTNHGLGLSGITEHLLAKWVPLLGPRMGRRYRDVVSSCLRKVICDENKVNEEPGTTAMFSNLPGMAFERHVVQELEMCTL